MRHYRIIATIALLIAFARPAFAQEATVEGTVHDALERPLAGATVALQGPDGKTIAKTISDSNGHFTFPGVAAGTYAVVATKADYETATAIVQAGTSGSATADLVLPAAKALNLAVYAKKLDVARNRLNPETGANAYGIDSQAIQNMPQGENTPVNQVLLHAPGVAEDSAASGLMHVRGEHANVQYRINGILLPDTISGFGQVVPSSIIDRIQLIDGALPAQYGFRTAGIVDIQTKSGVFNPGGSVDLYGGTNGTILPSFQYGGSAGAVNYFLAGSYLSSDQGIEGPTPAYQPLHDHTDQSKGFGYFSWLLNPTNRLNLVLGSSVSQFQVPNNPNQTTCQWPGAAVPCNPVINGSQAPTVSSSKLNINQREENYFETLALQGTNGDFGYQLAPYARQSLLHYVPDKVGELEFNGVASNVLRTNVATGLQGDASYSLSESHTLRSGFLAQQEFAVSNATQTVFPTNPDGSVSSYIPESIVDNHTKSATLSGVYLQDEWKLAEKLTMNYGARYDVSDAYLYESQLSPRLGFVYQQSSITTLHAGYMRTFTPPPVELVAPSTIAKFNGTTNQPAVPTDDPVKSESADVYDAGVSFKLSNEFTLGWDNYYKDVQNLLDEGQFGPALVLTPFNYARGQIYGSELSASYAGKQTSAYANFAWSVAEGTKIESSQFVIDPLVVAYTQHHYIHLDHDQTYTASAGYSYLIVEGTRFGFDGLYGSGLRSGFANTSHLPNYEVVNFWVTQHLKVIDAKGADLRFTVLNLFDEVYELRNGTGVGVGAPQFGARIGFYAGITKPF